MTESLNGTHLDGASSEEVSVGDVRTIAGFWRRLAACLMDSMLLGVLGGIAGFFLAEEFVRLGSWGRLLGFLVSLVYFGVLNSRLGNGQTLGKRIFGIKVVSSDGALLSVSRSFLRFFPLGLAWFLNGAPFSASVLFSTWIYVLSIPVFGVGLSVIYLYLFNRPSRQSLHDLMVGSFVVKSTATDPVPLKRPGTIHIVVCIVFMIASVVTPFFTKELASDEPFSSMAKIYRAVDAEPFLFYSQVSKGMSNADRGRAATFLNIVAYCKDPDIENIGRAKDLAALAIAADKSAMSLDSIQVVLVYGYDIGIASAWRSQSYMHSPTQWLEQ